ncbi:hypothetical protein Agub_g12527, partial [Astrephomene gubernaculifera]
KIMLDPIIDPDDGEGRAMEREAFAAHMQQFSVRPVTGFGKLTSPLQTLHSLKEAIDVFIVDNGKLEDVQGRPPKRACTDHASTQALTASCGPAHPTTSHTCTSSAPLGAPIVTLLEFTSDEVPVSYICPLSRKLMLDPVLDRNNPGVSWERTAIEAHMEVYGSNPLTGTPLTPADLIPARNIRSAIGLWMRKHTRAFAAATSAAATTRTAIVRRTADVAALDSDGMVGHVR